MRVNRRRRWIEPGPTRTTGFYCPADDATRVARACAGLPNGVSGAVRESVTGAVGTGWFPEASESFAQAFSTVSLAGAMLAIMAAWMVWRLVPASHRLGGPGQ